jgi:uncharacterized protein YeaO (DUF488 family)
MIRVKRVYEPPSAGDGTRVLVDRLWPRGLSKERAAVDLWLKEIAPSTELREWYGHDPARWEEFRRRYRAELSGKQDLIRTLKEKTRQGTVTLVYSSREQQLNNAVALKMFLEGEAE